MSEERAGDNATRTLPRVLIVEDSELVRGALRLLLSETGHHVQDAGSIADAIDLASDSDFDLMLLDLSLDDGDGLKVLEEVRSRGREPRVTVVLTGRDDEQTRKRCMEAGCRAVLLKPVPARDLLALVATWLA